MKYKLAILTSHPIQYQTPLWRKLANHTSIDLTVYFYSKIGITESLNPEFGVRYKWDIPLLEGYCHKFLSNWWEIVKELKQNYYDAIVVHGYTHTINWLAFYAAWRSGIPIFLRGTSTLLDKRSFGRRLLKDLILRILFHKLAAGLYMGNCNLRFYQRYGMGDGRLFFTPHCVDNDFFSRQADLLKDQRQYLRGGFGIQNDDPVILFCGKLIPKKRPLDLLRAFALVRSNHSYNLLFAGDGRLRKDIEEIVKKEEIPNVYISGFLNQSEISKAYAAADILVLPSSEGETWGLVINEGMNFGLPIIASDKVGASYDLIEDGVNGYVVPAKDINALTKAICNLIEDPSKREVFGRRSLEIIKEWNMDAHMWGIVQALETMLGEGVEK